MTISARGIGKTVHSSDQAAFCALMVAARKQAGLTQHELARRLKRPQSFVAKYEGGDPTSHLLFRRTTRWPVETLSRTSK